MTVPKRTHTPARGVPFVEEDPTPPPQQLPPLPDDWNARLDGHEAQIRTLTAAVGRVWDARDLGDRLDRLDHRFDRLDERLDKYADRVVRAESVADDARQAQRDNEPKLDALLRQSGDTARIADACEKLVDRIAKIETEQQVAAERFEAHDDRDKEIDRLAREAQQRVAKLEHDRDVADATARARKVVARAAWWRSGKGVAVVVGALAAAASAIAAAVNSGGCG